MIEILKEIREELSSLKKMIEKNTSPKMSKERAMKYLKYGKPKFELEILNGRIQKRVDAFGEEYYLRNELDNYLEAAR